MVKLNWQTYRKRLNKTKHSLADMTRETGISYPRIVGMFNGYWDPNSDELSKIEAALKEWEKYPISEEKVQ